MAVGILLAGPIVTRDNYSLLSETMFGSAQMREDQSPEGLLVHTAGETDQGWYVYDVWESEAHFQRFVESQLGPAIEQTGVGEAGRPEPQFFPIEVLVKGPAL